MHACDVMEDVAVAFSFNKIPRLLPPISCMGAQQPIAKLTELMRMEMAQARALPMGASIPEMHPHALATCAEIVGRLGEAGHNVTLTLSRRARSAAPPGPPPHVK
jgi:hypothetical protein